MDKTKNIIVGNAEIKYVYVDSIKGIRILSIVCNLPSEKYEIPEQIDGIPVRSLLSGFAKEMTVNELRLPNTNSPLILDDFCFEQTTGISTVIFSESVATIPNNCFYYSGVKEIKFLNPKSIQKIESAAFFGTKNLEEFSWPEGCDAIPDKCFYGSGLNRITGIDNIRNIGKEAFCQCEIEKFRWPTNCNCIPNACFFATPIRCIENIEHVNEIQIGAFSKCKSLTSFIWPLACEKIPENCFKQSGLRMISGIGHVVSIGDSAFEETDIETFYWPEKCMEIPHYCFKHSKLREIKFPANSLNAMNGDAFNGTFLKYVVVPEDNREMDKNAFNNMSELETIVFSKNQASLPMNSFWKCPMLKKITFTSPTVEISSFRINSFISNLENIKDVAIDMTQVSELTVEKSNLIDEFMQMIQLDFETNVTIIN